MRLACLSGLLLSVALLVPQTALAQDGGFDPGDFEDDDGDEDLGVERDTEGDKVDPALDPEDVPEGERDEFGAPVEDLDDDLIDDLEELGEDTVQSEGQDNSQIYRDAVNRSKELSPEDELIAWERYLEKYPKSLFRDRIDARVDELNEQLYADRIDTGDEGYKDAKDRELYFAQPILLENIDPRTRLRVSAELGLPSYLGGIIDYEHALQRNLSVHAGLRKRYTGGSLEAGAKYALVKSSRLNLIVTGIADVHLNTNPGFVGLRPALGAGKRFELAGRPLDVQMQLMLDAELGRGVPSVRYGGGLNAYYQVSDVVAFFGEGSFNYKALDLGEEADALGAGSFGFHVVSFGLRFTPASAKYSKVSLNANLPVAYRYWSYHFGSVQAEGNLYFDER